MSLLTILQYPDKRLHTIAKPVVNFDDKLKTLVDDMADTMYQAPGIGLAAPQVNAAVQVVVIDISEAQNQLRILINPEIIWHTEETLCYDEGCLSVPGIYDTVTRWAKVRVRAQNILGDFFEFDAEELLAICIQHELDHLNGVVFVEYLSALKRNRIKTKLLKEARLTTRLGKAPNKR